MNNIQRITSALLGFPLVILILVFGNKIVVDIALAIIAILALSEYFHAVENVCKPIKWVGYVSCLSISFIHIIPEPYLQLTLSIFLPSIIIVLFLHVILSNMKKTVKDIAYTFLGTFYIVLFTMFVAFIDGMPDGKILIWYAIFAAWGSDTFAYIVGKLIGKHHFSEISPKKTVEGSIGGVIGAVVLMMIYTYCVNTFLGMDYSYIHILIFGIILSIVGQIGDFAASSIKREMKIKDYSNLIPGHGGMLDRIDSLIFLAPFAYVMFTML